MLQRTRKLVFLAALTGCDPTPGGPASVDGKTPEEAAEVVTDVYCDKASACGLVDVECFPCEVGSGPCEAQCTVRLVEYPASECASDVQPQFERGFACEELTSAEIDTVDACLAAIPDEPCPTVEAVEAWLAGGSEGRDPREPLPDCDLLRDDIYFRCGHGE